MLATAVPGLGAENPGHGGAEKLVLRLPDVGNGYLIGDDSGCGGLGRENAPPSVAQIAITYYPVLSCSMEFERLWTDRRRTPANGAPFVESMAFVFASADGAAAALRVGRDFARYVLLDPRNLEPSAEHVGLGDEATVLAGGRNFAILWRRGGVVALLHVRGQSPGKANQVAHSLARRQDERIATPTPLSPRVNDDREVRLDNPRLGIPVYWLGLRFAPGHRLPPVDLGYVFGPEPARDGPGYRASIEYESERDGIVLELWKPRRWTRLRRSKVSRGFWDKPCARKRVVQLPLGHAELFRSCTKRRARFVAHAYVARLVVVASPYCMRCAGGSGAYGSFKGLTALVQGLRLRRH